jgi:hypothetical protein
LLFQFIPRFHQNSSEPVLTRDVPAFRAMAVSPVVIVPTGGIFLDWLCSRFEETLLEVFILFEFRITARESSAIQLPR